MEKENTCQNCKYFIQHYVIVNMHFSPLNEGHCICNLKNYKLKNNCKYWENKGTVKKERKEKLVIIISDMQKQLMHISEILQNENPFE